MTKLTPEQIDELIGRWHAQTDFTAATLAEYLGWTWGEYCDWVEHGHIPEGLTPMPWR